jgi:hypothetical protein
MFVIRWRGLGEVEPHLLCAVCRQSMGLTEAWLGFSPPTSAAPQSPGQWVHKACASGRARSFFDTTRVTLWHAPDFLHRLLVVQRLWHENGTEMAP